MLPGDEVFHFYLGSTRCGCCNCTRAARPATVLTLGPNLSAGQVPQLVVPGWGVAREPRRLPDGRTDFALLGATMAPGFDYADYRGGSRAELVAKWPSAAAEIARLTPRG